MDRKSFLKSLAAAPFLLSTMNLRTFEALGESLPASERMPALFIGHGSPMNALADNDFTRHLASAAERIARPTAVLVVSAHWETRGTYVSVNPKPPTIYDFGGFDERLYQVKYPAEGHPALAREVVATAPLFNISEDHRMGLDHGAWSVLRHLYPDADVPVFQLSIDYTQPPAYHYELGRALRKMREKGVLVLGSGNIVHNLGVLNWSANAPAYDWATTFDELVKARLDARDDQALVQYQQLGSEARLAIPTTDHYLPMLYVLGLAEPREPITYLHEGIEHGSISMRCFLAG
jgi:4,5-DOPA dioxygenase extradiol